MFEVEGTRNITTADQFSDVQGTFVCRIHDESSANHQRHVGRGVKFLLILRDCNK